MTHLFYDDLKYLQKKPFIFKITIIILIDLFKKNIVVTFFKIL